MVPAAGHDLLRHNGELSASIVLGKLPDRPAVLRAGSIACKDRAGTSRRGGDRLPDGTGRGRGTGRSGRMLTGCRPMLLRFTGTLPIHRRPSNRAGSGRR